MAVLARAARSSPRSRPFSLASPPAAGRNWAAPQIRAVTQGRRPRHLARHVRAAGAADAGGARRARCRRPMHSSIRRAPAPPPPEPAHDSLDDRRRRDRRRRGHRARLEIESPDRDGRPGRPRGRRHRGRHRAATAPYEFELDTSKLADGAHQLAVNVAFVGGGDAIAVWRSPSRTCRAPFSPPGRAQSPCRSPSRRSRRAGGAGAARRAARALPRGRPGAAGLGQAARRGARRLPRARRGRARDPGDAAACRAAAAAEHGHRGGRADARAAAQPPGGPGRPRAAARPSPRRAPRPRSRSRSCSTSTSRRSTPSQQAADAFTLPDLTPWQRRILPPRCTTSVIPYIWGGTSPTAETLFGVHSAGGFDCSGFVWRVVQAHAVRRRGRRSQACCGAARPTR